MPACGAFFDLFRDGISAFWAGDLRVEIIAAVGAIVSGQRDFSATRRTDADANGLLPIGRFQIEAAAQAFRAENAFFDLAAAIGADAFLIGVHVFFFRVFDIRRPSEGVSESRAFVLRILQNGDVGAEEGGEALPLHVHRFEFGATGEGITEP